MEEEHLLNAILEKTHEAIIAVDENQVIIKCNQKMIKLMNSTSGKVIGMSIKTMLPGFDNDKEISNYEFETQKKNFIVRAEKMLIEGKTLKVYFFSDNHFNIELGNRYAEMKVLVDTYESILNSIDEGIHVADIDGNIKYINPSQQRLDGLTDAVIGKHWTEVYDLDDDTSLVLKALNEAKYTYDEYQNYVTRGGKYVSIVCSAMPIFSENKIIGAVAITKDILKFKELAERVLHIHQQISRKKKNRKSSSSEDYYRFNHILGKNKLIQESIKWGRAGAKSDSSVLIYGETGTGKEMFAQSIHTESNRASGPFVAINCAAIPENLLEGILFGTTKGAFTGAIDRAGLIELAGGGTLFLDEINSMPFQLQSKLLRMLEEKKVMRLGAKESISVDIRVLATCNLEPSEAIEKGQLRSDLFYRLAVIYIYLPPLRDRTDDLAILIGYFIDKYNREMDKQVTGISSKVKEMFYHYRWPGNVRELMHCIECSVNLVQKSETLIQPEHLPRYLVIGIQSEKASSTLVHNDSPPGFFSTEISLHNTGWEDKNCTNIIEQIQQQEKKEIITALKESRGNIAQAAASLGLSRQKLHYRLKKYNLR